MRFLRSLRTITNPLPKVYRLLWLEFSRGQRVLLSVMFGCVVVLFGSLAMASIPFAPLSLYSFDVKPDTVCPLAPITTIIDNSVEKPRFGTLGNIEITTKWVSRDGRATPEVDQTLDLVPYPRAERESPLERSAPRDPGMWAIDASYIPHGRILGIRRSDLLEKRSEHILQVLDEDSPQCSKEA